MSGPVHCRVSAQAAAENRQHGNRERLGSPDIIS
jgi:hypothetical protein